MSVYDERPWTALYAPGLPHDIEPEHDSMLAAFRHTADRIPDQTAVQYFDLAARGSSASRGGDCRARFLTHGTSRSRASRTSPSRARAAGSIHRQRAPPSITSVGRP